MADTFGLKIGLEGEKEFKSQLREIDQSFKVLGSEMKLVDSQFEKNEKSVESLTTRNSVLDKSISSQKEKIVVLKDALDNSAKSFGENDARTKAWQTKLNEAQAELNNTEKELKSNKVALSNLSNEMGDSSKEADKFEKELKDAGEQAEESGSKFSLLGGIVTGVGVALAAAFVAVGVAAIKAGKALVQMAVDGAAYADDVLTQSAVTGIATNKLQEYMYAAELMDVSLETLTGSMKKNIMAMKNASNGSAQYTDAYDKLGVSVTDANGELRNSDEVYWELIEALGNVENETERDALAMTLLGKSAQDLNPLIKAGSERMKELSEEAHKAGYVMSNELLEAYGAFDDQIQYFNNGLTAAKNSLGTILLPLLTDLTAQGSNLLGEFTKGVQNANGDISVLADVFGEVLPKAFNVIMQYVPTILNLIKSVVVSLGKAITDNSEIIISSVAEIALEIINSIIAWSPQITQSMVTLFGAIVSGIIDNLPALVESVIIITDTVISALGNALPTLLPLLMGAIINVAQTIVNGLPKILSAVMLVVQGVAKGILNAIPILISALPNTVKAIISFILSSIPQFLETVIQIVGALVEALPEIIHSLIEAFPEIVTSIIKNLLDFIPVIVRSVFKFVYAIIEAIPTIIETLVTELPQIVVAIINALLNCIPKLVQTGVTLLMSLITNLPTIIVDLVKAVPQIITSLVKALGDGVKDFAGVGANLVKGLWEGIQSLAGWLWDKVSNWAQNLWNNILNFFGIHSPSRKFMFVGDMLMQGLGKGIDEGADDAVKKADRAVDDINESFSSLGSQLMKFPSEYDISANASGVAPKIPTMHDDAQHNGGAFSIELHIENFNNYSGEDVNDLTNQILETANSFVSRKGMAY